MLAGYKKRQYFRALENSVPRKQGGARKELIHSFIEFLDTRRSKWLGLWPGKMKNLCILSRLFLKLLSWWLDSDRLHGQSRFVRNRGIYGSDRLKDRRPTWQVWGSECFRGLVFLAFGECNQETENHYGFVQGMPTSRQTEVEERALCQS